MIVSPPARHECGLAHLDQPFPLEAMTVEGIKANLVR